MEDFLVAGIKENINQDVIVQRSMLKKLNSHFKKEWR